MKKLALAALAGSLALAACADATVEGEDAATDGDVTATDTAPVQEGDTTIINEAPAADAPEGSSVTIDGADVDATISEDGVDAKVNID